MKSFYSRPCRWSILWILGLLLVAPATFAQQGMTKAEYYDYLTRSGRIELPARPIVVGKTLGISDVKRSVFDIGNVRARIRNTGTLGYDRDLLCYEFPFNSTITYRWTLGPMIAGKIDGQKLVSGAAYGAARGTTEDEFLPLKGFDADQFIAAQNIGIAFSDKPASWPSSWPTLDQVVAQNGSHVISQASRDAFLDNPLFDPMANGTARIGDDGFPGVFEGDVRAPREAYFVITDNDPAQPASPSPMNVRIDVWGLQWDDFLNRNFIIYRLVFTNIGDKTIEDVYVGIHDDPDAPEQGSNEWTDDFAYLVPPGKDVDGDGVPDSDADPRSDVDNDGLYTADDSLLWNTIYLWDGDDQAEGFLAKEVGWVGLKFLETPDNPDTGKPRGVTTLDVFQYTAAPVVDTDGYDQMAGTKHVGLPDTDPQQGGDTPIQEPDWPDAAPNDVFQIPNSYGPDITITAASGPYTLEPGQSLPFAFASVHGTSQADMLSNAKLVQTLYDNDYQGAIGPPIPHVVAVPGDGKVTLYWDDIAETGIYPDGTIGDPFTGNNAFEGYKIFRSDDRGQTWGKAMTDISGTLQGFIPLAIYDLDNGVTGESETRRFFDLGKDTGLRHRFVDNDVDNGKQYLYAVVAYDREDDFSGRAVPPLENPINLANPDTPGDNTVRVTPMAMPGGTIAGNVENVAQHIAGSSDVAELAVEVIDPTALMSGKYQITFEYDDEDEFGYVVKRDGATVEDMTGSMMQGIAFFDEETDFAPVFDGVRVLVENVPFGVKDYEQTSGDGLTLEDYYIGSDFDEGTPENLTADYEIRFVSDDVPYAEYYSGNTCTGPFEVYNLTTGERVTAEIIDSDEGGTWNGREWIIVVDSPFLGTGGWEGDYPADYALYIRFEDTSTFETGDAFRVVTNKAMTTADVYEFNVTGPAFSADQLAEDLDRITVVPNPFVVSSEFESGRFGVQRVLQFHQLPDECTIRIFTVAGELVQKLDHRGGSIEPWDLQSYNGQEVGFGVYLYIVQTPDGQEKTGKFAVIK